LIQSADEIPKDTVLDADLLIVGAGAAGISIAREFAGTALRVILLESGGLDFDDATLAGNAFSVSARATVVATGGIETARLLLLSDKVHTAGAGNENDLVGRYFLDHVWIDRGGYLRLSHEGLPLPLYFDEVEVSGGRIFAILRPDPAQLRRDGIGSFRVWLRPSTVSSAGSDSLRDIVASAKQGEVIGQPVRSPR
jgi:choline dehydrogenase-like flavoprotein